MQVLLTYLSVSSVHVRPCADGAVVSASPTPALPCESPNASNQTLSRGARSTHKRAVLRVFFCARASLRRSGSSDGDQRVEDRTKAATQHISSRYRWPFRQRGSARVEAEPTMFVAMPTSGTAAMLAGGGSNASMYPAAHLASASSQPQALSASRGSGSIQLLSQHSNDTGPPVDAHAVHSHDIARSGSQRSSAQRFHSDIRSTDSCVTPSTPSSAVKRLARHLSSNPLRRPPSTRGSVHSTKETTIASQRHRKGLPRGPVSSKLKKTDLPLDMATKLAALLGGSVVGPTRVYSPPEAHPSSSGSFVDLDADRSAAQVQSNVVVCESNARPLVDMQFDILLPLAPTLGHVTSDAVTTLPGAQLPVGYVAASAGGIVLTAPHVSSTRATYTTEHAELTSTSLDPPYGVMLPDHTSAAVISTDTHVLPPALPGGVAALRPSVTNLPRAPSFRLLPSEPMLPIHVPVDSALARDRRKLSLGGEAASGGRRFSGEPRRRSSLSHQLMPPTGHPASVSGVPVQVASHAQRRNSLTQQDVTSHYTGDDGNLSPESMPHSVMYGDDASTHNHPPLPSSFPTTAPLSAGSNQLASVQPAALSVF
ncbi:hypothetical protein EON66_01355, partial [archaeon]